MPTAVEERLKQVAGRLAASGKLKGRRKFKSLAAAKKSFVYGTMTNMQKAGSIPAWRKLN